MRRLWNVRLSSALKENGTSYSKFIGALKKKNISLNRKMLSELAASNTSAFQNLLAQTK
jgi:large subunit ribosomal protein L20